MLALSMISTRLAPRDHMQYLQLNLNRNDAVLRPNRNRVTDLGLPPLLESVSHSRRLPGDISDISGFGVFTQSRLPRQHPPLVGAPLSVVAPRDSARPVRLLFVR